MADFFKVSNNSSLNVALNYDKANLAVQLVNAYDSNILRNVSTIVPLSGSAYGVYMNSENIKGIDPKMRMIFRGYIDDKQIDMMPKTQLIEYFKRFEGRPGFEDVDFTNLENSIEANDTIRVNVNKILSEIDSEYLQVIEVASTIIHEATHANEMEEQGSTSEAGPEAAERAFASAVMSGQIGASLLINLKEMDEWAQYERSLY